MAKDELKALAQEVLNHDPKSATTEEKYFQCDATTPIEIAKTMNYCLGTALTLLVNASAKTNPVAKAGQLRVVIKYLETEIECLEGKK